MRVSRRALMIGGAAATGLAVASERAPAADATLAQAIDAAVGEAIAAHACPGVQVAVARHGTVLFSRGYGFGEVVQKLAVNERSVFRIGSLTKQFTAAAIIKLAAQGKVTLDAPVAAHLPFMGRLAPLTLLELMHHTAGLHSDESDSSSPQGPNGPRTQVAIAEEIAAQKAPFDFPPGTAWLYSNANYIVLGAAIEAATGKPLAQALSDLVFMPLGLNATAMDRSGGAAAGQVTGYSQTESKDAPFQSAAYIEISDTGGAGAMRATALDLCRWHAALLSHKLFGPEELAILLAAGKLRDGRVSGANRFSPDDAHYGETQYAGGLLVTATEGPKRNILHYGAINGFASVLQTWLDSGITMAVLCNCDIGPAIPFRAVRQAVVMRAPHF